MDKDLTPLGELLESAREALRPKLSQNAVAKRAQTSPTTYRRVITGVARLGGRDVPFDGKAETIARIAQALGVTPEQLEGAGRGEAAHELRLLSSDGEPTSREQRVPIGQAVESNSAPAVRVHDARLEVPDPLAGLPADPDERLAELARRIEERSIENARITAERRRLAEEITRITGEDNARDAG